VSPFSLAEKCKQTEPRVFTHFRMHDSKPSENFLRLSPPDCVVLESLAITVKSWVCFPTETIEFIYQMPRMRTWNWWYRSDIASSTNSKCSRNWKFRHPEWKFVRPSLEYASTVWDPHTQANINKVESIQRRAARFVTNNYDPIASVTTLTTQYKTSLNWPTLQHRR
jgi:hypothetical protein